MVPSVPQPPAAWICVASNPPSRPRGSTAKTRVHLDRCLQCIPSCVPGSEFDLWAAEWCQYRTSRGGRNKITRVERVASLLT